MHDRKYKQDASGAVLKQDFPRSPPDSARGKGPLRGTKNPANHLFVADLLMAYTQGQDEPPPSKRALVFGKTAFWKLPFFAMLF